MKANNKTNRIKFVRKYENNQNQIQCDIIYHSGRSLLFVSESDLPETVKKFINTSTRVTKQYDYTSTRKNKNEIIYEA